MPSRMPLHDASSSRDPFATTHWSLVIAAGRSATDQSAAALETLCQTYWPALYAYVRRRVATVEEAQDLTQAFFAELLEKNYVATATPQRGRFRAYLLTALKHFLSKQWQKRRALKRGGGRSPIHLDFESADSNMGREHCDRLTPEQLYDRQWAVTLLEQIMQRLESEFTERGKRQHFCLLKGFLTGDQGGKGYASPAAELGITEAAARMAAHRMRQRYRELLRQAIAHTVADQSEVDDEIRKLFAILEL